MVLIPRYRIYNSVRSASHKEELSTLHTKGKTALQNTSLEIISLLTRPINYESSLVIAISGEESRNFQTKLSLQSGV